MSVEMPLNEDHEGEYTYATQPVSSSGVGYGPRSAAPPRWTRNTLLQFAVTDTVGGAGPR